MARPRPTRPIKLYRNELYGHCHRAELFLRLLELPIQMIEMDFARKDHKRADFVALNAFGQLPVIDDDGSVVPDSNAILVYLALRYADESWLPRDAARAARVQRWLSIAAGPLAFGAAVARWIQVSGQTRDTGDAIARAHQLCGVMEQTLSNDAFPFLVGTAPTIADIALYSYTAHAPEGNVSLADYPHVRAWLGRIQALPGFVPMKASAVGLAA